MFDDIKKNPENIIIILSRGVEKLIKLFFKNKLPHLKPFFILGANNIADINEITDEKWADKKARAIKYIYDFTKNKMKGNIMFYDDTKKNIEKVNKVAEENKIPQIKAFLVNNPSRMIPAYKNIFNIYKESLKSLNIT